MSGSELFVPTLRLSTDGVPHHEKQAFWREAVCQDVFPITPIGRADPEAPEQSTMIARPIGEIAMVDFECNNRIVRRTPQDIARGVSDCVFLFQQVGRHGSMFRTDAGDTQVTMGAGEIYIADADEPFESISAKGFSHRLWMFPRRLVASSGAGMANIGRGFRLSRGDAANAMLSAYLGELSRQLDTLTAESAAAFAANAASLIGIAAGRGAPVDGAEAALGAAQLARVKRSIQAFLRDPLISPARIAAHCGISVRKIHRLFEPTGLTFSQYVLKQRVEEARIILLRGDGSASIADIAYRLGFNSLATFYRAFRAHYDETPGDLRTRSEE